MVFTGGRSSRWLGVVGVPVIGRAGEPAAGSGILKITESLYTRSMLRYLIFCYR
jgi:hypothetical protein